MVIIVLHKYSIEASKLLKEKVCAISFAIKNYYVSQIVGYYVKGHIIDNTVSFDLQNYYLLKFLM